MELALSILVGVGLSAACGFRVFVPLLVVNLAARAGHLKLALGFDWMGSDAALVAFGVATVLEIAGYYLPWVDHLLDTVATPASVVAGTLITASLVTDLSPFLRWTLAAIMGGGVAGAVQVTTVVTRAASTATTGGIANPLVATAELGGAAVTSLLAVIAPVAAAVLVVGVATVAGAKLARRRTTHPALPPP